MRNLLGQSPLQLHSLPVSPLTPSRGHDLSATLSPIYLARKPALTSMIHRLLLLLILSMMVCCIPAQSQGSGEEGQAQRSCFPLPLACISKDSSP